MKTFDISCDMFSNTIGLSPSLVLKDSDTDSENVSLILPSVSAGQKRCNSKGCIIDKHKIKNDNALTIFLLTKAVEELPIKARLFTASLA